MAITVEVNKAGSFNIKGPHLIIRDCFPGVNRRPIHPLQVDLIEADGVYTLTYTMDACVIVLKISAVDSKEIVIESSIIQEGKTWDWFHPICYGEIEEFHGIFRQGLGMGGPSGYLSLKTIVKDHTKIESYGIVGLSDSHKQHMIIYGDQHDRFVNSYQLDFLNGDTTRVVMNAGYRLERLNHEKITFPKMHMAITSELEEGLTSAAKHIAENMNARTSQEPLYHWCSWYYLYNNLSHEILRDYLKGFSQQQPAIPLKYMQIDAGYFPAAGDWLTPNHLWPDGMKAACDDITANDYKPGIWIGPYMVGNQSKLYKTHPDWILYDLDGQPVVPMKFYNEPQIWGYLDEEYFVLDTSHPDAMAYIRHVFRTFKEMGIVFFKTDFMKFGFQDSSKVKRHTPGKTSVEYFRDLLEVIREEIGEESYWLGCIAPFLPFIGYADGMRVGGDVGAQWKENDFGPINMIREIPAVNYFNHVYWQNDPDAMMLRDFHIFLNETEVESLTLLQAVSGGVVCTSDPLHEIAKTRVDLFRLVEPRGKFKTNVLYLDSETKETVLINEIEKDATYNIFIFNPTQEWMTRELLLSEVVGVSDLYVRAYKAETIDNHCCKSIVARVEPHGCKLFFASKEKHLQQPVSNIWSWYSE